MEVLASFFSAEYIMEHCMTGTEEPITLIINVEIKTRDKPVYDLS